MFSKSSVFPKLILSHLECPRLTANMVLMSSVVVMADAAAEKRDIAIFMVTLLTKVGQEYSSLYCY